MCQTKICTKCGEEKNIDQFDRHKKYKSGRRSSCKSCRAEYRRKNRDDIYEKQKEYRKRTGYKPKYKSKSRDWISERQKKLINEIKAKFGDQYDLSKVKYIPNDYSITVGCKYHGFITTRRGEFLKKGCGECSKRKKFAKASNKKVIEKAEQKHGWWFDLSLYHIRISKTNSGAYKRIAICPIHGPFITTSGKMTKDCVCPHCAPKYIQATKGLLLKTKRSKGDKYNCSKCGERGTAGVDFRKRSISGKRKVGYSSVCNICLDTNRVERRRTKTLLQNKRTQIAYSKCTHCNDVKIVKQQEDTNHYCEVCKDVFKIKQNRIKVLLELLDRFRECVICGNTFASFQGNTCCSNKCKKKLNRSYRRAKTYKKRCDLYGCYYQPFNINIIFKRDKNKCQICGCKTKIKGDHNDLKYRTIDHIIPLALGGSHTPGNCQTACRDCNNKKLDKVEQDLQLSIFSRINESKLNKYARV